MEIKDTSVSLVDVFIMPSDLRRLAIMEPTNTNSGQNTLYNDWVVHRNNLRLISLIKNMRSITNPAFGRLTITLNFH